MVDIILNMFKENKFHATTIEGAFLKLVKISSIKRKATKGCSIKRLYN